MKMNVKTLALALMLLIVSSIAFARPVTLKFGTGGETGDYFGMSQDIEIYCADPLKKLQAKIEVFNSNGSVANLQGMEKKDFNVGLTQVDVLQYMGKRNPRINEKNYKVIAGLHQETVYLLIPTNYKPKKSGMMGMFSSLWGKISPSNAKIEMKMLEGQVVATQGGAVISAKALKYFTGINFTVLDVSGKSIPEGLPVLLVGGQPYQPVTDLLETGNYVLVSLDANKIQTNAGFYSKVTVNYSLNGQNFSADTVGVRAYIVGRSSRVKGRNAPMVALATCIRDNLLNFEDDSDTNPNWASVVSLEDTKRMNWRYFLNKKDGE